MWNRVGGYSGGHGIGGACDFLSAHTQPGFLHRAPILFLASQHGNTCAFSLHRKRAQNPMVIFLDQVICFVFTEKGGVTYP